MNCFKREGTGYGDDIRAWNKFLLTARTRKSNPLKVIFNFREPTTLFRFSIMNSFFLAFNAAVNLLRSVWGHISASLTPFLRKLLLHYDPSWPSVGRSVGWLHFHASIGAFVLCSISALCIYATVDIIFFIFIFNFWSTSHNLSFWSVAMLILIV